MLINISILIIFHILFQIIKSDVLEDCEIGNYCSDDIKCSTNGNCKFDIFNITSETFFNKVGSKCVCNTGFSSYDIDVLESEDNDIYCCYEQKSQFIAFFLEFFLGFGIGHFYINDIKCGLIKFFLQLFLCIFFWCFIYAACNKEHLIVVNLNDINNKKEINENYNKNDIIDNEETKALNENKSSELESKSINNEKEDQINELLTKNLIKCPLYNKILICLSMILYIFFQMVDVILMGLGYYKDGNGADLAMWYY